MCLAEKVKYTFLLIVLAIAMAATAADIYDRLLFPKQKALPSGGFQWFHNTILL